MSQGVTVQSIAHENNDAHQDNHSKTIFGFWVYLMSDCILFASLFATYAVLHTYTFDGPPARKLFHLPFALNETLILLTSSFTSGLVMLAAHKLQKKNVLFWLGATFLLGLSFLVLEISEFTHLVHTGNSWQRSAFLTSYFTLVGTHGLHILTGLLWIVVLGTQIAFRGLTPTALRRVTCFSLFWHFLDIIWIFIFTIVYLMGAK